LVGRRRLAQNLPCEEGRNVLTVADHRYSDIHQARMAPVRFSFAGSPDTQLRSLVRNAAGFSLMPAVVVHQVAVGGLGQIVASQQPPARAGQRLFRGKMLLAQPDPARRAVFSPDEIDPFYRAGFVDQQQKELEEIQVPLELVDKPRIAKRKQRGFRRRQIHSKSPFAPNVALFTAWDKDNRDQMRI